MTSVPCLLLAHQVQQLRRERGDPLKQLFELLLSTKTCAFCTAFCTGSSFSSLQKTTYASQIKLSRLAQVDDILAREGDILVYPGFTCQTSKSPITQGAPPTQWPVGQGNPETLSLFLLVYLSGRDRTNEVNDWRDRR